MTPAEPISMYVPARNAERTLADCIAAIRAQSRPADELFIVVDPRSSDRTVEVARGLGVPVIEQTGRSLGAARNQAIQAARHRWLASCDSDVFVEPDWLARLAARRDEHVVGIGGRTFEHVRNPFDDWRAIFMPHHWGEHSFRNPFMLVSEVMFDRQALLAIGGYRDDLNYYEDSDLCQRLRDAGYDFLYEPAAVARHQRSDTLRGLLDLRWKYSEYRQLHLLDRYTGLLAKMAVNRDYALNTMSRLLARGREDVSYVSFLLFFHHLLMDLRSLHSRRPLLPTDERAAQERQILAAATTVLGRHSSALARQVQADLLESIDCSASPANRDDLPAWPSYVGGIQHAVDRFCTELAAAVLAIVETSSQYVLGRTAIETVRRLGRPTPAQLQQTLDELALAGVPTEETLTAIRRRWPGVGRIELAGRATLDERNEIDQANEKTGRPQPGAVAFAPHLEGRQAPLDIFAEGRNRYEHMVICYQPPSRFIAGLDVPSAADLAAGAAAAGWTIDQFDTFVGRTRLMVSR